MQRNPQFLRTDKAIKQALITLLQRKSFEKITIQDILDETPVTRSTFYKHFHDKYEIVERMQDDFFDSQLKLRVAAHNNPSIFVSSFANQNKQTQELLEALLKVHTEKVDIRNAIAKQGVEYYLRTTKSKNAAIEAEIFAQAVTAFQLSLPDTKEFSFEYMHSLYISVFLQLLGLSDDEELRNQLAKKAVALPAPPL